MNSSSLKCKLLIVEDTDDQWLLIKLALQESFRNAIAHRVSNQSEALQYLKTCQDNYWDTPNLILLDLYLPRREDGWLTLRAMKGLPAPIRFIPIIILSHSNDPKDISETYIRGGASYLVKPTTFVEWTDCIKLLKNYWWDTATLPLLRYL